MQLLKHKIGRILFPPIRSFEDLYDHKKHKLPNIKIPILGSIKHFLLCIKLLAFF